MLKLWVIQIQSKNLQRFAVNIEKEKKINELKKKIEIEQGLLSTMQLLIHKGQVLKNDLSIDEIQGISENVHLLLYIKPQPLFKPKPTEVKQPSSAATVKIPIPIPNLHSVPGQPIAGVSPPINAEDFQAMLRNIMETYIPPTPATVPVVTTAPTVPAIPPSTTAPLTLDLYTVKLLTEMGFPEARAIKALYINRMNADLAMEWLLLHGLDPDIDVPLTQDDIRILTAPVVRLPTVPQPPRLTSDQTVETAISQNRCTFSATGPNYKPQKFYHCYTCGFVGNEGVCQSCANVCHAGHHLSEPTMSNGFYCDCGPSASQPGSTTASNRPPCQCMPKGNT